MLGGERGNGVVNRGYLGRVDAVVVDYGVAGEVGHGYDVVGIVHAVFLDAENGGVGLPARAVKLGGVNVDDEGLAGDLLGMDACGIGEPVVGVNHVKVKSAGDYSGTDGIIVDFFHEVVGVTS